MYKVLLAEDEDIIRKGLMFTADWGAWNCLVAEEASDGEEGVEKIRQIKPDIVVADIRMPVKSGLKMLEETIGEYGYEAIILSGYSDFEYARQALRLGVTEYLLKPVDFQQLSAALETVKNKLDSKNKERGYIKEMEQEIRRQHIFQDEFSGRESGGHGDRIIRYVEEHFAERITLTDLSEKYELSCTYLNAKFKAETGYTFLDFLNRYRISQAVKLLKKQEYRIYEIAEMVGFSDYKYFIKVFKKYAGCSPNKFLESYR